MFPGGAQGEPACQALLSCPPPVPAGVRVRRPGTGGILPPQGSPLLAKFNESWPHGRVFTQDCDQEKYNVCLLYRPTHSCHYDFLYFRTDNPVCRELNKYRLSAHTRPEALRRWWASVFPGLLKQNSGSHTRGFGLSRSGVEAERLRLYQVPRWCRRATTAGQLAEHRCSAVPGPAAAASPGGWLEMCIFRPDPELVMWKLWRWVWSLCFNKPPARAF